MTNNIKRNIKIALVSVISLLPVVSFAALEGIVGLLGQLHTLINATVPVIFGLALLYFFWGTGQFILKAGEPKAREEGRQKMVWGIVALFVMFSIWGILNWIGATIGIKPGENAINIGTNCPPAGNFEGGAGC